MTGYQLILLAGGIMVEVGRLIGDIHGWQEATTPGFIGAACVSVGLLVAGIKSKGPQA